MKVVDAVQDNVLLVTVTVPEVYLSVQVLYKLVPAKRVQFQAISRLHCKAVVSVIVPHHILNEVLAPFAVDVFTVNHPLQVIVKEPAIVSAVVPQSVTNQVFIQSLHKVNVLDVQFKIKAFGRVFHQVRVPEEFTVSHHAPDIPIPE